MSVSALCLDCCYQSLLAKCCFTAVQLQPEQTHLQKMSWQRGWHMLVYASNQEVSGGCSAGAHVHSCISMR